MIYFVPRIENFYSQHLAFPVPENITGISSRISSTSQSSVSGFSKNSLKSAVYYCPLTWFCPVLWIRATRYTPKGYDLDFKRKLRQDLNFGVAGPHPLARHRHRDKAVAWRTRPHGVPW